MHHRYLTNNEYLFSGGNPVEFFLLSRQLRRHSRHQAKEAGRHVLEYTLCEQAMVGAMQDVHL